MCPNCQAPLRGDEDFCTTCGTALNRSAAPTQQPPTQQPPTQQPLTKQPPTQQPPAPYNPAAPAQGPYGAQTPGQPPANAWPGQQAPGQQAPGQQAPGWPGQAPGWQAPQPRQSSIPPFTFDLKRLGTTDYVIGGATFVLFVALFLPWFGYGGYYSVIGVSAHPFLVLSLLIAMALLGYLFLRTGWETLPFKLPVAHAPLLLISTGAQLLFVLLAFLLKPSGLSWQLGAYLSLLAALTACGVIALPAIQSMQGTQRPGT